MTAPTITRLANGDAELRFPYDAVLIERLKASIPAHARTYDPTGKTWTVAPAYISVAARLMSATFPDVELVEPSRTRAPADPYAVLHLRETAPPELIVAAQKCLAKLHHPDRGGSPAAMLAINSAVDAIRKATP